MSKVEIRDGDDWIEVSVDGEQWYAGHRMENRDFAYLLKNLGHDISLQYGEFEADGSFSGEEEPLDDDEEESD